MRKLIVGILVGLIIGIPATAVAASYQLPWAKNIYRVGSVEPGTATVSVFDDANNKCYVLSDRAPYDKPVPVAISCVAKEPK